MNREFIIKSNQAAKELEEKGFDCIGGTAADNFKTVCIVKKGKQHFFKNYIEANEQLKN